MAIAPPELFEKAKRIEAGFYVMPDVGDLLGAMAAVAAGAPAIGTSSVGLGLAMGCPSTQAVSRDAMLSVVETICRAVDVPVFVDLEQGYADTPEGVAESVRLVLEAGAVGFNIEDSEGIPGAPLRNPSAHAERIIAAREAADALQLPALITGRADPFWINADIDEASRTEEAIRRCNIYLDAGADSVFVSGRRGLSLGVVAALIDGIDGSLNTLIGAGRHAIVDMRELGVHRLQTGSMAVRAQTGFLKQAFSNAIHDYDSGLFAQFQVPTSDLNKLFDNIRKFSK